MIRLKSAIVDAAICADASLHWKLSYQDIWQSRKRDLIYMQPAEYRCVQMHLHKIVRELSSKLQIRQQAIATAMVYILRFYTRAAIVETDVYLVAAACLYLACKVEECPQHIRTIAQECLNCHANSMTSSNASVWQDGKSAGDVAKIAEVEFHLIDELETQLIIHHPYRVLSALNEKLCLPQKDFDIAWVLCNETYSTDVPLLYSPHAIAYTAVYLSISLNRARGGNIPPSTDGTSGKDPVIDKLTAFVASTTDQVPLSDVANCAQMFLTHLVILDNLKLDKAPPGSFSDSWRESMNARAILKRIKGEELARVRKQKLPENLLNLQRPSSRQQK